MLGVAVESGSHRCVIENYIFVTGFMYALTLAIWASFSNHEEVNVRACIHHWNSPQIDCSAGFLLVASRRTYEGFHHPTHRGFGVQVWIDSEFLPVTMSWDHAQTVHICNVG